MELSSSVCSISCVPLCTLILFHECVPATETDPRFELLLFYDPVVLKIKIIALSHEEIPHHAYELLIVRFFFEFELSAVVKELTEFTWVPGRQVLNARNSLLDFNLFILFLLGLSWQALPGKGTHYKVHQHYPYLL